MEVRMKKIFSKKWRYFSIGCVCVFVLLLMQSWLTILACFLLFDTYPAKFKKNHPKIEQIKKTEKQFLIGLILLPFISLLIGVVSDGISRNKKEKEEMQKAELIQAEKDRIANALVWDIDTDPSLTEKEKEFVKNAADNAIKNEKQCVKLRMGGRSTIDDNHYYIECVNLNDWKFKFYFTEEEVAQGTPIKIEEPYDDADLSCMQAISLNVKFPDTVLYKKLIDRKTFISGDTDIIQDFTSENAYGMPIRNRANCTVSKEGIVTHFEVK
jgi:hypothetical protein